MFMSVTFQQCNVKDKCLKVFLKYKVGLHHDCNIQDNIRGIYI
jgi:hypothetical protein